MWSRNKIWKVYQVFSVLCFLPNTCSNNSNKMTLNCFNRFFFRCDPLPLDPFIRRHTERTKSIQASEPCVRRAPLSSSFLDGCWKVCYNFALCESHFVPRLASPASDRRHWLVYATYRTTHEHRAHNFIALFTAIKWQPLLNWTYCFASIIFIKCCEKLHCDFHMKQTWFLCL